MSNNFDWDVIEKRKILFKRAKRILKRKLKRKMNEIKPKAIAFGLGVGVTLGGEKLLDNFNSNKSYKNISDYNVESSEYVNLEDNQKRERIHKVLLVCKNSPKPENLELFKNYGKEEIYRCMGDIDKYSIDEINKFINSKGKKIPSRLKVACYAYICSNKVNEDLSAIENNALYKDVTKTLNNTDPDSIKIDGSTVTYIQNNEKGESLEKKATIASNTVLGQVAHDYVNINDNKEDTYEEVLTEDIDVYNNFQTYLYAAYNKQDLPYCEKDKIDDIISFDSYNKERKNIEKPKTK